MVNRERLSSILHSYNMQIIDLSFLTISIRKDFAGLTPDLQVSCPTNGANRISRCIQKYNKILILLSRTLNLRG